MNTVLGNILNFVIKKPKFTFSAGFLILLLSIFGATKVGLDNDVKQFFPQGDPEDIFLQKHQAVFGSDDESTLIVLLEMMPTIKKEADKLKVVSFVEKLSDDLSEFKDVVLVDSITHTSILSGVDDAFIVSPAFGSNSALESSYSDRMKLVYASTIGGPRLVSSDGQVFVIAVQLEDKYRDIQLIDAPSKAIKVLVEDAVKASGLDIKAYFGGVPYTRVSAISTMQGDLKRLIPFVIILVGMIVYYQFRKKHALFLLVLGIGMSVVMTMGSIGFAGGKLSPLSIIFPILLITIGVADGIHFLSRYHEMRRSGLSNEEAIRKSGMSIGSACFLTSFTTAVGFASLMLTRMEILRSFGIYIAVGVILAYLVIMTLIPAGLTFVKSVPARARESLNLKLESWIRWIIKPAPSLAIIFCGTLLAGASLYFCFQAKIDSHLSRILPAQNIVTKGNVLLDEKVTGSIPMEVSLIGEPEIFKTPDALGRIEKISKLLKGYYEFRSVSSISGLVREVNRSLTGKDEIPADTTSIAQFLFLLEGDESSGLGRLVNDDFSRTRMIVTSPDKGCYGFIKLKKQIQPRIDEILKGSGISANLTGATMVASRGIQNLVAELLSSLLMALVFIAIAVFIAFRSFKMVLVSLLPNVLPLLFSLAWFGASGQFLDIAPAVAFSIAIGIAVDNNIHIISRYFEELDNHNDYYEAIVKSVVETINPILNTTFILIGGFLILSLSEFTANQMFGYLASAIIFIALLFSFIFAPAALALFKPEKPGATKLIKREDDTVLTFDTQPMANEDLDEDVTTEEINLVTAGN